ncbi:Fn3-like domain-containing protein [Fusarium sp. LHS14.1]|nr:Fn3-like domain-containing protein [Fusarium sp. LHS14.1]
MRSDTPTTLLHHHHPVDHEKHQSLAFDRAVKEVGLGHDLSAVAARLLTELSLTERLHLLDGDVPFWEGLWGILCDRYNRKPFVIGAIPRLNIPGVKFTDGPRDVVMGSSTAFPISMARGATWDIELERRIGNAIGLEAKAQGANYFAGVCINLPRHPAWGRIQETYGEDPVLLEPPDASVVFCEEHRQLAREVAHRSMVLLKNYTINNMPLLPLNNADISRLALIGRLANKPNTGDKGSSQVFSPTVVTPYQGLEEGIPNVEIILEDDDRSESAARVAEKADVAVVVVGYDASDEGEYMVPSLQNDPGLSELFPPTNNPDPEEMLSIVQGNPAQGQQSSASARWGRRLPFSIPQDESHLPDIDIEASAIKYDLWYGQSLLDKLGVDAAFPLGYGLSYTEFRFSNLEFEPRTEPTGHNGVKVAVDVENTGQRSGHQVAQVYGYPNMADFPHRVLLGFGSIYLQAGELKRVFVDASLRPIERWVDGQFCLLVDHLEIEVAAYAGDKDGIRKVYQF